MKNVASLANCWMRDLSIHFVISIRMQRASIPGGHIGSVPEQRMPDGGLTILCIRGIKRQTGRCEDPDRCDGFGSLSCRAGDEVI